ncbi:MAG: iron-containing alcohol dehydrogenase [Planctomycetales bacterium]
MVPFDFQPRTRIVFGPGRIDSVGELAAELGRRALVVSDSGIVAAGHVDRALDNLRASGLETALFSDVQENPTTETVDRGLAVAKDFQPDVLIGLGGGSSMDCAKGINFLYTNGGRMQDYWGRDKASRPMLPAIAAPTTAGTGSETQSFALISDAESHVKMACGDAKAACRVALLDPTLTVTQPARVTALTGIDAIAHAIETFVTNKRTPISLAFSREAWRLLHDNFALVLNEPENLTARGGMQLGASLAGLAIENSMLGAAHAAANPLTANFGLIHGHAVAVMLPHVIRFNGVQCEDWYQELSAAAFSGNGRAESGSAGVAEFVTNLASQAGLSTNLRECGVEESRLPQLADEAAQQWTGGFNPRKVEESSFLELYRSAY